MYTCVEIIQNLYNNHTFFHIKIYNVKCEIQENKKLEIKYEQHTHTFAII